MDDSRITENRNDDRIVLERINELISKMTVEEKVSQLTDSAAGISRLGISEYGWWNEALHGVARAGKATVFPQAIGIAATWNVLLTGKIAAVIAQEARAKYNKAQSEGDCGRYSGLTFWSPNVNIFRDPRWGRGQETYGEDPYLTSRLAVAFIRNLQNGEGKHLKAAACAKHFAAHSGPEELRHGFNAEPKKKDLFETYLPAFEACVKEGKVEAIMGAYNAVDGVPCCCNEWLLKDVLREKWGFKGHVVSDCGAICDIHECHHFTQDAKNSAAIAVRNGCDLNCGTIYESLVDAWEQDLITEDELDEALRHTLGTRFRLGMFDEKTEYDNIPYSDVCCEEHRKLSLQASRESLVLLKNDGMLPLDRKAVNKIAVVGVNGDSFDALVGNYNGTPFEYRTVFKGFSDYIGEAGAVSYAQGCDFFKRDDKLLDEAEKLAGESDLTVVCLGLDARMEGEQGDYYNGVKAGDRDEIGIIECQRELLERVSKVSSRVVLLIMCGSAVTLGESKNNANAVFHCWYPGENGGLAIAEAVFGEFSPSGRMPVTTYKSVAQLPDFTDYSMKNRTYRYFDGEVEYPFGYGLSYTKFSYGETKTEYDGNNCTVSVSVTNTGKFDGMETVRLFRAEKNAANQPIKILTRFEKIELKKGEEKTVRFSLTADDFSHIDENGEKVLLPSENFSLFIEQ